MTQLSDAKSMVFRLLTDLSTPRSLAVYLMAKHGEWDQLTAMDIDPKHYLDTVSGAKKFAHDFQATELLRKCSDLEIHGIDKAMAAREGWLASERENCRTNARLTPWLFGYPSELEPHQASRIWSFIQRVRKEIRRVLGPVPDFLPMFRFGPGTVAGVEQGGRFPTAADKLSVEKISITTSVQAIFAHGMPWAWESAWRENSTCFEYIRAERFSTVLKNARTDRTIGIQALANLSVQLAIGSHWKQRLQYSVACLDLIHGQHLHACKARAASLSGEDATIDHKNASNSTARILVKLFFPEEWYEICNDSRMAFSAGADGRAYRLEMFSAMGNGFTFELETLVFWAIARACGVERPLVYGDDVIIPSKHAADYIAAARYFGYETNSRKTYTSGPFRESCGGNYFDGWEITPFRLTELPREPADWIKTNNGLWRAAGTLAGRCTVRARIAAISALPVSVRGCRGPEILGDLVLHGIKPNVYISDSDSRPHVQLQSHVTFASDRRFKKATVRDVIGRCRETGIKIYSPIESVRINIPDTIAAMCRIHDQTYYRVWAPIQHLYPFERWGGSALQTAMALLGLRSDGVGYRDNVEGYKLKWLPVS